MPCFFSKRIARRNRKRRDFNTVDIVDRLSEVRGELSALGLAIHDLRVGEPESFGLYLILRRQIDAIQEIKVEIHPPLKKLM